MTKLDIMQRLLVPLWLRPESAMWYAHMLHEARRMLKDFENPAMEFGCMDGLNTFVLLGGEFEQSFDIFSEVKWDKSSHTRSTLKDDYFDTAGSLTKDKIIQKPHEGYFDLGLDWKESHIKKAKRLNVFRDHVLCNPNKSLDMIQDKTFQTIWAPNLYWIENLSGLTNELSRILRVNGRIVTIAPGTEQLNHSWYRFADKANKKWLQDLDRGRYENSQKTARTYEDWISFFNSCGLEVSKHRRFIPSIVGEIYDIGFRPMFPVFMNMYEKLKNSISSSEFLELKQHWIDTISHFLEPLCDTSWMAQMEHLWHIFELKKKKQ
jgi:hypothetical protein